LIENTHGAHAPGENLTIDLISIAQQMGRIMGRIRSAEQNAGNYWLFGTTCGGEHVRLLAGKVVLQYPLLQFRNFTSSPDCSHRARDQDNRRKSVNQGAILRLNEDRASRSLRPPFLPNGGLFLIQLVGYPIDAFLAGAFLFGHAIAWLWSVR